MDSVSVILKYFTDLNPDQIEQFNRLGPLYADWNSKINVISRKDMDHFYERHVLHSLAIAKYIRFSSGQKVMDIGTGGGFPGIPLAILFPEVQFILVDSIGKKIKVVESVVADLQLCNVKALNVRAETVPGKVDFVVSRATAPLSDLVKWTMQSINKQEGRGLIALKGGDLDEELKGFRKVVKVAISDYFQESFFETKQIIHLPAF